MYTLSNVSKFYGQTRVLKDVSCAIHSDDFTCVMGPSGSGKSTLLRLLSFVERPTEGELRLRLGPDTYDADQSERPWPAVTAVFQSRFLWPHLTLRENIALPLRKRGDGIVRDAVERCIEMFSMHDFIDRYPNEVSGGQSQRVALARAFALEPKLILIDEAHGGLDVEQQHILNEHLSCLREEGIGLIVITHSLGFARRYADSVVVIERGALAEAGPRRLLDDPRSDFLRNAISLYS